MQNNKKNSKHACLLLIVYLITAQFAHADSYAESSSLIEGDNNHSINQEQTKPLLNSKAKDNKEKCNADLPTERWVDRVRRNSHRGLCKSVMWIDGLFGNEHEFEDENFSGKLSIGFRQDEDDGFDPRLRVRLRTKLPNVSNRLNAFIGRVDEDSYISNTEVNEDSVTNVGLRSNDDEENEWLVGLGYRKPNKNNNGFDFSVGAKLSSGIRPYAKIAHRHLFNPSDKHFIRSTQTVFWRRDEKFGVSTSFDYTYLLNRKDIIEFDASAKYTEEDEQWEWVTGSTWHHSITQKKGISSRVYVRGEEENPVSIPEYGLTFTYIRPFLRPWLFLETGVDFRWEKEDVDASYKSATRFGLQVQMLLGDYYKNRRPLKE